MNRKNIFLRLLAVLLTLSLFAAAAAAEGVAELKYPKADEIFTLRDLPHLGKTETEETAEPEYVTEVPEASVHDPRHNTVMIYMCGSDLESKHGAASMDIVEMLCSEFSTESVNVLVMTAGTSAWAIPEVSPAHKSVWELHPEIFASRFMEERKNRQLTMDDAVVLARESMLPVRAAETTNMGSPQTLEEFLAFSKEYYPAEQYSLILWNHGGGPNSGVCSDLLFDSDTLSIAELTEALENSAFAGEKLSWIGFDACLMGSAEVAVRMAPYAEYMIASEESEPGVGWCYYFLENLEKDANGAETGRRIVENYMQYLREAYSEDISKLKATLSCIDLSAMDQVRGSVDDLFGELKAELTAETYVEFAKTREAGAFFGHSDDSRRSVDFDLMDLKSYVDHLEAGSAEKKDALRTALDQAIIYQDTTVDQATGLSVYYPYFSANYYPYFAETYKNLNFSEGFMDFIQSSYDLQVGASQTSWSGMNTSLPHVGHKDVRTLLALSLTEEQMKYLAEARLTVFVQSADGTAYALVANVPDVSVDETGLSAEYVHRALFVTDAQGTILSVPVPYTVLQDGTYSLEAVLIQRDASGQEVFRQKALLHMIMNDKDGSITVTEVLGWDEVMQSYTQRYGLSLNSFSEIVFTRVLRTPVEFEDGTLKSYEEWETVAEEEIVCDLANGQQLSLLHNQLAPETLSASFSIRDYQNRYYLSGLTTLAEKSAAGEGEVIVHYDDLERVTLGSAQVVVREDGDNTTATLSMDVTNITDRETILAVRGVKINQEDTDLETDIYGLGDHDGLMQDETQRMMLKIPSAELLRHLALTEISFDLKLIDPETEEESEGIHVRIEMNRKIRNE